MMAVLFLALAGLFASSVAGQSCSTPSGPGVCRYTTACPGAGGTSVAGYCPGPTNYQCCVFKSCTTPSGSGKCRPISECSGTKVAGYCPGPSSTQCCLTSTTTSCGSLTNPYPSAPRGTSGWNPIMQFVVNKVYGCFKGKFNPGDCTTYRSSSSTSDHPGNAADCFPGGGCVTSGTYKAEGDALFAWARANYLALKIDYVIWQNCIWSRSNPTLRCNYRTSGTCTDKHYDHVHISVI